jgi:hypothetical protein
LAVMSPLENRDDLHEDVHQSSRSEIVVWEVISTETYSTQDSSATDKIPEDEGFEISDASDSLLGLAIISNIQDCVFF